MAERRPCQSLTDVCCSFLQDVLTDLSAECEQLPVEGVSGACYAHKVRLQSASVRMGGAALTVVCLQGMCQAAGYIYRKLVNDGILNQAFSIAPVRTHSETPQGGRWGSSALG